MATPTTADVQRAYGRFVNAALTDQSDHVDREDIPTGNVVASSGEDSVTFTFTM